MIDYQILFDGIVTLLEKNVENHPLVAKCLKDCSTELSFIPAKKNVTTAKSSLMDIYKITDEDKDNSFFIENNITELLIWYLDTENGSYTIFTDKNCVSLAGMKYLPERTLTSIRKNYFKQQETLSKIGEQPTFDYSENEITFINKKLVE